MQQCFYGIDLIFKDTMTKIANAQTREISYLYNEKESPPCIFSISISRKESLILFYGSIVNVMF